MEIETLVEAESKEENSAGKKNKSASRSTDLAQKAETRSEKLRESSSINDQEAVIQVEEIVINNLPRMNTEITTE